MRDLIRDYLESCSISRGDLQFESIWTSPAKKATAFLAKAFKHWTSDSNAESTLYFQTAHLLRDNNLLSVDGPLKDVLGTDQIDRLVTAICEYWAAVPRTYAFYFPLLHLEGFGTDKLEVCTGISLLDSTPGNLSGHTQTAPSIQPGRYLYVAGTGLMYLGASSESAVVDAVCNFKRFVVLGGAKNVLTRGFQLSKPPSSIDTVDLTDPSRTLRLQLPQHITQQLQRMQFAPRVLSGPITLSGLMSGLTVTAQGKRLEGPDLAQSVKKEIAVVGRVLQEARKFQLQDETNRRDDSLKREGPHSQESEESRYVGRQCSQIAAAAEWLYDARTNPGTAVSYVQTCIALEALYGDSDKDKEPIGATVANRAAYGLSISVGARKRLFDKLKVFYNRRSGIVHGGGTRLDNDDLTLLNWADGVLTKVLSHEMDLVSTRADLEELEF